MADSSGGQSQGQDRRQVPIAFHVVTLVPELTYEGMEAWESLLRGGLDKTERDRIRRALLDYCGRDTLAMIRLVGRLRAAD